jgi:hypothetical protein
MRRIGNDITARLAAALAFCGVPPAFAMPPITVQLFEGRGFATFTNRLHPDNQIGYRFHEHAPILCGQVPESLRTAGIDPDEVTTVEQSFAARPGVQKHVVHIDQEKWAPQQWVFYLSPVDDGVELLLVVETRDTGLNEYYGIQQCFRMSGRTNADWRREIAETPAFSEYDLWNAEKKDGSRRTSLTHVLRKSEWADVPATDGTVGARTPLGMRVDTLRSGGRLDTMPTVGPYEAKMLDPVDCGLIVRTDKEGRWVCGIFWDRTSHVTDHHPADCLHSIVNIGGIPPHARRAIRGKIYWFKGSLGDLLERWRRDWPGAYQTGAAKDACSGADSGPALTCVREESPTPQ